MRFHNADLVRSSRINSVLARNKLKKKRNDGSASLQRKRFQ